MICSGCVHAPVYDDQGNEVDNRKCPFCRTPWLGSDEEELRRLEKQAEAGDAVAMYNLGIHYATGSYGLPQDFTKAFGFWHQAAELGYAGAHLGIGDAYFKGRGVEEIDEKKARHYFELAAIGGNVNARHNLGFMEIEAGHMDRAFKHWMISARGGDAKSLSNIKQMYSDGYVTKDDYMKALKLYQTYLGEIKSDQRDKAAAVDDKYRYY